MGRHPIDFQNDRKSPREEWADREGTPAEAMISAQRLLKSLRDQGFPRAQVWMDGTKVTMPKDTPETPKEPDPDDNVPDGT